MKKLMIGGAVVALAAIAVLVPDAAFAQQVKDSIDNAGKQLQTLPTYINYASYIIGTAMGVAGVSKLKAHVDNPGQTPIKDGLGRLGAAGLFIALPALLEIMRASNKTTGSLTFTGITTMN